MQDVAAKMSDFPKIQCPFVREEFDVNVSDWEAHGSRLMLRTPKAYLVLDQINEGYEWVFEDKETFATEKLDGTNVKLNISEGRLIGLQNRKNIIDPLQIIAGKTFMGNISCMKRMKVCPAESASAFFLASSTRPSSVPV